MNYTLNQLRIFLKVVQHQSVTKASEDLNLTQPAVSIQLRNFQQQFDIPLTEIINKRLYVTDFGKEVAKAGENILNEAYAISYKASAYKGQLTGRLKISVVSTAKYVMPYFLSDFMQQHGEVELDLSVTNRSQVVESLEKNEVDFSMVSIIPEHLKLDKIELMPNQLYLVGKHPISEGDLSLNPRQLESLTFIFREDGSATRMAMEGFIRKKDLQVRKKIQLSSNEAVKQTLLAGLGYSVMPMIGIKREVENGELCVLPVDGLPIKTMWHLVWLSDKKLSPVAEAYIRHLNEHKGQIMGKYF